jgi:hypothetical protein
VTDTTRVEVITAPDSTIVQVVDDNTTVTEANNQSTLVIATATIGPRGEKGEKGDQGLPGDGSVGAHTHEQSEASADWHIVHNLGYRPAGILVVDSAGSLWEPGDVEYLSANEIVIHWSGAFSGKAYLS